MRSIHRVAFLFAALQFAQSLALECAVLPSEPFVIIRPLQRLQDRIVKGSHSAYSRQRELLTRIAERLSGVDPGRWQNSKNVRAAVTFVLSGGRPRVLTRLSGVAKLSKTDRVLVRAALAYSKGRRRRAYALFSTIDPRSLSPGLGGHVALVRAMLIGKTAPKEAVSLFDEARLLSPGTLVEEAALRRQAFLVANMGNFEKFVHLSAQYLYRFPASIYAHGFRKRFASEFARRLKDASSERLSELETVLDPLAIAERREAYLDIAREAILRGKIRLSRFAIDQARAISPKGGADSKRLQVYEGAALIVTDHYQSGIEHLEDVDRGRLAQSDIALLDAARDIAKQIRLRPWSTSTVDAARQPVTPRSTAPKAPAGVEDSKVIARARAVIDEADALIRKGEK